MCCSHIFLTNFHGRDTVISTGMHAIGKKGAKDFPTQIFAARSSCSHELEAITNRISLWQTIDKRQVNPFFFSEILQKFCLCDRTFMHVDKTVT